MAERPTYHEQLTAARKKAYKAKDAEAVVYYDTRGGFASASFETFKGSWAYSLWIASAEIIAKIVALKNDYNFKYH